MTPSEAVDAFGSKAAAARALGMPVSTLKDRLRREIREGSPHPTRLNFPALPDHREPIEDLIERQALNFDRKKAARKAATWQQIHVTEPGPYGLALIGDPHIDDDGCNWRDLLRDVAIMRETEGVYGINIGDTTNNWVGRLARLFANQETSQTSARQLAEWFLTGSGVRWAAVVLGNHDLWNEGAEIISRMCARAKVEIPVHEWQAKIEFVSPDGSATRLNAAHDFKGRSGFSTTHGLAKEAIWFQDGAHLAVAGHIHFGGLQQIELPGGRNPWLARVRGYKEMDSHALYNGFHEGQRFASVMAVIDPDAPDHERVMIFSSLAQGAAVLKAMRSAYRGDNGHKAKHAHDGDTSRKHVAKNGKSRHVSRKAKGQRKAPRVRNGRGSGYAGRQGAL